MRTAITILIPVSLAGAAALGVETTMPRGAVTNGGSSWGASDSYAMSCSLGLPCSGGATGEDVGLKGGFWSAICVAEAPEGFVNPGWVWLSLPIQPQFPEVSAIFETDPRNRLYQWDWLDKTMLLYPSDFTQMVCTQGYLLRSLTEERPRYSGFLNLTPVDDPNAPDYRCVTIYIPAAGAITLGHPFPWPVRLADVKVRYGDEVRTAQVDRGSAHPWVNWNWVYWDSTEDTAKICSFSGGDDTMLRPWYHYRVWFYVPPGPLDPNGPFLLIPEPEAGLGG
jgi:hypothetical protein